MKFSVLMSVYHKESAENLRIAINSVLNQTCVPSEIVLVKDGPLTEELEQVLATFNQENGGLFKFVEIATNKGLGNALRVGVMECSYSLIARMDTDDSARGDRFEKQLNFLNVHPEIDVLGGNMEEFNLVPGDLKRFKINPETHEELIKGIYFKNPFNHPTVMYRKQKVLEAGNYTSEHFLFEDYALFLRMWKAGMKFYNLQEVLLDFRVGDGLETIKRRSGAHYLKKENEFLKYAKELGVFSELHIVKYKILKFPVRIMPPKIVLYIYNTFLRKQKS